MGDLDVFSDIPVSKRTEPGKTQQDLDFIPLSVVLAEKEFGVMTTPYIVTKEKLGEWLVKHLSNEIDSIYVVGWRDPGEPPGDPLYIPFSNLLDRAHASRNTLFIIEDLVTFTGYMGEISLMSHTHNFFLILTDVISDKTTHDLMDQYWPDAIELWPAPLDVPIDIVYNRKKNLISGGQLREYRTNFVSWRKLDHTSYDKLAPPESLFGILNVYLDDKVPSIESISRDIAIQRAPKFRNLIQSLLFHNKKRHFISMIPGKRGITAFESLYGKLDMGELPIHVIRSGEPLRVKEDKIEQINSSNSPLVVLSDFHFTEDMAIKNIDYYHITSGGNRKDIISILTLLKGHNYTGTYPRKLHVNNYITETPASDLPVDGMEEKQFWGRLNEVMEFHSVSRSADYRVVFLEGVLNVVADE